MKCIYALLISIFCFFGFLQQGTLAFPISGNGSVGSFDGDISYNPTSTTLTVSLTNISPVATGGFLTAFALGTDSGLTASAFSSTAASFANITPPPINASPFGVRYIGASASTNGPPSNWWLGGGNPSGGLAVNSSAIFNFTLTGNIAGLTEQYFQDAISSSPFFVARFRGFNDGSGDKVPAIVNPEPATIALLGIGLAGLAGAEVRRRRKKKAENS